MAIKLNGLLINEISKTGVDGMSYNIDYRNLGEIVDSGFYYGNDMTGGPESSNYGYLLVICHNGSKDYCVQTFFPQGDMSTIYFRQKSGSGHWLPWYKINTTLV